MGGPSEVSSSIGIAVSVSLLYGMSSAFGIAAPSVDCSGV